MLEVVLVLQQGRLTNLFRQVEFRGRGVQHVTFGVCLAGLQLVVVSRGDRGVFPFWI